MSIKITIEVDNISVDNPPYLIDKGNLTEEELFSILFNITMRRGADAANCSPEYLLTMLYKDIVLNK